MEHQVALKIGYNNWIILILIQLFFGHFSYGQKIDVMKSDQLFEMIDHCDDESNIKVYNFWATWCAPCIRELPQFNEIDLQFSSVDVTLISIDDVDLLNERVEPFISKKQIDARVVLLDETDFDIIINNIDKSWSGAIPATLIVDCRNNKRYFYEKEFKDDELKRTIETIIN